MPVGTDQDHTGSDYGSDFNEDEAEELHRLLNSIEFLQEEGPGFDTREDDEHPPSAQVPAVSGSQRSQRSQNAQFASSPASHSSASLAAQQVLNSRALRGSHSLPHDESPGKIKWETEEPNPNAKDTRSPIERFRTAPKKPLSVTDIISPAWCELQYWYNLINYGRVKQTVAMQRGSELHKVLEEEVHHVVPVDVQTREDTWGLRIWNVIQGLRTLRITGMTRELELWGSVDGHVINGIIDEISVTCTDSELENSIEKYERTGQKEPQMPSDQTTISQFFSERGGNSLEAHLAGSKAGAKSSAGKRKIYITDVKTRGSPRLPSGAAMRPTYMQLMLYRRLLSDLACDRVDPALMFDRYRLDPNVNFSDALIAQLSQLDYNFDSDSGEDFNDPTAANSDVVMELISNNSLNALWSLMTQEFKKTVPQGEESISKVLKVEYRSSKDGSIVGIKTFPYREDDIASYVHEEMRWWRGERDARGVDIEEAYKCRMCEFADGCTWRLNKIQDAVSTSRAKRTSSKKEDT